MRLLLISTAGAAGVVALATESGVLREQALPGRGASEALLPAMRSLFASAGWAPAEVNAVAVVNGPGSFTGVRVGLAAAKGFCDAANTPLIMLSRLALLAGHAERSVAVLDAGRGEFFCGVYEGGQMQSEALLPEGATRQLIASSPGVACEEKVAFRFSLGCVSEPGAEVMRCAALTRIAAGDWSDVALSDAKYLRRTDAELKVANA